MATKKMFSIRDSKGEFYQTPFYMHTHGEAERAFTQLAKDPKSTVSQFPEDFDLYYLGEYDEKTGKFAPVDTPQHMVKAAHLPA